MTKSRGVTQKQLNTIRSMAHKGYSSNRIYRRLKTQHQGMRRTKLLGYVREFKGRPARPSISQYVPRKYRKIIPISFSNQKQVAVYGTVRGKPYRIQMNGSGQELYKAMKDAVKHPPKKQFLTSEAREIITKRDRLIDENLRWDRRPRIESR